MTPNLKTNPTFDLFKTAKKRPSVGMEDSHSNIRDLYNPIGEMDRITMDLQTVGKETAERKLPVSHSSNISLNSSNVGAVTIGGGGATATVGTGNQSGTTSARNAPVKR
mmetsp:Transcript_33809/g.52159  ORF Transcript_33809/g.52159 Transcript_33809/m.52159 type:complete len:109 (+) Transcript_33809:1972-2298(+)